MPPASLRVLLIEPDPALRQSLSIHLLVEGYDVDEAESLVSPVAVASRARYDAIVLGLDPSDDRGTEKVLAVKETNPAQELLVVGGVVPAGLRRTEQLPRPAAIDAVVRWLERLEQRVPVPA